MVVTIFYNGMVCAVRNVFMLICTTAVEQADDTRVLCFICESGFFRCG